MKVTKRMLQAQVKFLNKNLNRPEAYYVSCFPGSQNTFKQIAVGHFYLGINAPGDGWTRYSLLEVINDRGGVYEHFAGNNQDVWA